MTFGTTSLFHRQVASALGIPAKYYDLMQSQKPELLAENVNAWFADRSSSYMVRSMDYGSGQVARALLSERYRRIDNMEIATSVLPLFAGNDQYEVMSCEVTENRLYLKVVNHRLEMEVRKGDIVQAGVMISNSEVGLGAVSIQPLIYRLVCLNGMTVCDMGERRHHVGRQAKAVEDSFTLYSDETMEAEDKAFLLKLRDTTMAAIDEARFAQVVGRLQESMAVPITGKVQDVVQLTSQSYGINADEQEGMDKILFLNEKDRNTGLSLEHSDYRYKTTKPVAATKPKHDEVGFTIPYAMFRPIREPGLLCELLGDNPVRRTADLKMNFDFLVKDLYENEISRLMYVVRLEELRCRLIFSSEDRAWERYTRLREKGQQAAMPKVTSDESRKTLLKAITWKYDWIQQHKIQCFRFAEAVYARQMKDETSQSRFIEAFIQYAANLPEPNRRLLDEMYELAWYDIQLYPCSLEGKRLVKPWYDTKESGDGKC